MPTRMDTAASSSTATYSNKSFNHFDPDLEFTHDTASSYIDILSDDDAVTSTFMPQSQNSINPDGSTNTTNRDRQDGIPQQWSSKLRYSFYGTIFNLINCIVGAGAIGLGGAMSASGGIVSCIIIIAVAILVKCSLDLIIDLSINLSTTTTISRNSSSHGGTGSTSSSNSLSLSYEDLGHAAYGTTGRLLVMVSKFVYAFGCVVAYTIIIHDNFGPAIRNLFHIHGNNNNNNDRWWDWIFHHDLWCTWLICTSVILPLCLMRDMSTLASTSFISIIAMLSIVGIVIYMWYVGIGEADNHPFVIDLYGVAKYDGASNSSISDAVVQLKSNGSMFRHWFTIRWHGLLNNMGTFVFSFVCHHTVHLTYRSLVPEIRNLTTWKYVSTISLFVSCTISLSVAIFCYMTFWDRTVSDIFQIYPDSYLIDMARLLLCITMLLTFPLPFFTCRELLILILFKKSSSIATINDTNTTGRQIANEMNSSDPRYLEEDIFGDINEPLLLDTIEENVNNNHYDSSREQSNLVDGTVDTDTGVSSSVLPISSTDAPSQPVTISNGVSRTTASTRRMAEVWNSALLPNDDRQLKLVYHVIVTCKLWFIVTTMALAAPNLGDVLDFVGCCSGTLIAFVLPGLFAIRLQGWTYIATIILLAGGMIGIIGTICSLQKLSKDTFG